MSVDSDNFDWDEYADEYDFTWEEVERVHITRDGDEWTISVETDGNIITFEEGFSDADMEGAFWDDLYWYLLDEDIDIDREIDYAGD